ncbi:RNA 2'-phosphotransferase [Sphingomonas sp. PB4P5]|uniref:RNA 2'-phosphotransferase n=1 Tax=Parasphingomonas puruogangriensis TaxID=3096155 RepID=UPI002FC79A1C
MSDDVRLSKMLSLWLRHHPEKAGITLDPQGWTDVDDVLAAIVRADLTCDWLSLLRVVDESDKQRFELSGDASRIRARQGHSVVVDLRWPQVLPPELLYHGTVERFLPAILTEGLCPMRRHHVHLSPDQDTATRVAKRRGAPAILTVRAHALAKTGQPFFLTSNAVWLTSAVPPGFLEYKEPAQSGDREHIGW